MSGDAGLWGEMGGMGDDRDTIIEIYAWYTRIEGPMAGSTWVTCKFRGGRRDGETCEVPVTPALAMLADEMPR